MALKIWDVLSESKCTINAQPRHFLTLSLIFLLPLSFLSLIFKLILKHQQSPTNTTTNIIFLFLFLLISSIFTSGAVITITYSVYHAFFSRPVKLNEAIKSICTSFFPLLATSTVTFVISFFIFLVFGILTGLVLFLIIYLGDVDVTTNPYLVIRLCSMVLMIVLLPLGTYLSVNLSLVNVIVVVESCWGFEPLRRSWKLVKGIKRLVLSFFYLFGFLQWILVWIRGYTWALIFVVSPILALLLLYNIVVYTVLYIYCKEKYAEVAEVEFGKEKDGKIHLLDDKPK